MKAGFLKINFHFLAKNSYFWDEKQKKASKLTRSTPSKKGPVMRIVPYQHATDIKTSSTRLLSVSAFSQSVNRLVQPLYFQVLSELKINK